MALTETPAIKSLREQELEPRKNRILQLRDVIAKENRDFTAEERADWEKVNKEYDGLKSRLQILTRANELEHTPTPEVRDIRDAITGDYDGRKEQKRLKKFEKQTKEEARNKARRAELEAKRNRRLGWNAPHITEEDRANSLQAWMRVQSGRSLKWYHQEACQRTGVNPRRKFLDIQLRNDYRQLRAMAARGGIPDGTEARAQSLNINTSLGYTVPEGFVNNLEIALLAYANVRQWATVIRTMSGQDLPWPVVNDSTVKGSIIAENAQLSPTAVTGDIIAQQVVLHAYKYTSTPTGGNPVLIPVELMEDSAFDLASTTGTLLGIRIGRIQADHFTTGTGQNQPTGYITAATVFTAANATSIGSDDLYKLIHKVDPAYRALGPIFTVHDQIYLNIKLLKDGAGRPLWQPAIAGGAPDQIDNFPVYINQSMDNSIATTKKSTCFGLHKKYIIRDVTSIRLRRLVERYADSDQEAFVMFTRGDGQLLDAGTHPLYVLQH